MNLDYEAAVAKLAAAQVMRRNEDAIKNLLPVTKIKTKKKFYAHKFYSWHDN